MKNLLLILIMFLGINQAHSQLYYRNCPNGNCPTAATGKTNPSAAPAPAEKKISEEEAGKRTQAEVALRGSSVVCTDPAIHATAETAAIGALALPENDQEYFQVLLFGNEKDAFAKGVLECWKNNETLLAIADPDNAVNAATKSKFQTVNMIDPTAQDLVKAYNVKKTPTVIIQSAKIDVTGIPKNTILARIEGWDGNGHQYAHKVSSAFREGVKRAIAGQWAKIEQTEKRSIVPGTSTKCELQPIPTTLQRDTVEPQKGLMDVQVIVPTPDKAITAWENLCQSITTIIMWLAIALVFLAGVPFIITAGKSVVKGASAAGQWYVGYITGNRKPSSSTPHSSSIVSMEDIKKCVEEMIQKTQNKENQND